MPLQRRAGPAPALGRPPALPAHRRPALHHPEAAIHVTHRLTGAHHVHGYNHNMSSTYSLSSASGDIASPRQGVLLLRVQEIFRQGSLIDRAQLTADVGGAREAYTVRLRPRRRVWRPGARSWRLDGSCWLII